MFSKNWLHIQKNMDMYFLQAKYMMGLSAVYDYGQYGVELKNNIKKYWWDSMVPPSR